jgi:hypothetical protein
LLAQEETSSPDGRQLGAKLPIFNKAGRISVDDEDPAATCFSQSATYYRLVNNSARMTWADPITRPIRGEQRLNADKVAGKNRNITTSLIAARSTARRR